ncbi:MAG: hypothetical protein M3Q08_15465 [Pseudomonadota bacterium]|nr:hypothetical protein [Pseudomonadota bacterium]
MKKALVALVAVVAIIAIAFFAYVPLSPPDEICARDGDWDKALADGWRLEQPMALAWSGGHIYVADAGTGTVKKIRTADGTLVASFGRFERPVAVATAPDGSLYVADFTGDRIVKLASGGSVIGAWGGRGRGPGEFDAPSGIAVHDGHVYVADFYNHRVQKFTTEGRFVAQWGGDGRANGRFHYPTDVAVGPSGRVIVADAYNHRVQTFTRDGAFVHKWGGTGYGLSGGWAGWFRLAKAVAVDRKARSTPPMHSTTASRNSRRAANSWARGAAMRPVGRRPSVIRRV